MDTDRALEILRYLANGVDPFTGEVLGPGGPLQHPDAVRALFLASEVLDACDPPPVEVHSQVDPAEDSAESQSGASKLRQHYMERDLPSRAYEPWTGEEDQVISDAYRSGMRIGLIAEERERTTTAIRSRLKKLGLYGYGPGTAPPIPRD